VRQRGDRGAAHAGDVEPDDVDPGIQRIDQRLQHLEAGSDAAAHENRCSGAVPGADVDPQLLVADRHEPGGGIRRLG